jgi:hypothetical protein
MVIVVISSADSLFGSWPVCSKYCCNGCRQNGFRGQGFYTMQMGVLCRTSCVELIHSGERCVDQQFLYGQADICVFSFSEKYARCSFLPLAKH